MTVEGTSFGGVSAGVDVGIFAQVGECVRVPELAGEKVPVGV